MATSMRAVTRCSWPLTEYSSGNNMFAKLSALIGETLHHALN